jgi:hypothetical protein
MFAESNPFEQFSFSNSGVKHTGVIMAACHLLQLVSLSRRQVASLPFQRRRKNVRRELAGKRGRCCSFTSLRDKNVQNGNILLERNQPFG